MSLLRFLRHNRYSLTFMRAIDVNFIDIVAVSATIAFAAIAVSDVCATATVLAMMSVCTLQALGATFAVLLAHVVVDKGPRCDSCNTLVSPAFELSIGPFDVMIAVVLLGGMIAWSVSAMPSVCR